MELVKQDREKKLAKEKKEQLSVQRKKDKETRERLKSRRSHLKEAQIVFNKFIRLRDEKDPCISCGKTEKELQTSDGWMPGGIWDCGHYLSRGGFPELRFEELNSHKQCKTCNGGAGQFAKKNRTVSQQYRINLIKKIGIEKLEWLEGPHEPKQYTIENIVGIRDKYKDMAKQLQTREVI